ncbi:C40 family peptidase [Streptomyces polygonati]|uniref:C40 family peptidase n=1 Tax=Streptomyces polygonati TaxID=1617087 RepID=A0ABV8HM37_9ACTN
MADNTRTSTTTDTASTASAAPASTRTIAEGAQQAAAAFEQDAVNASLTAAREQAAADAAASAAATKKADDARAAAARKAARLAKERAAAAKAAAAKAAAAAAAAQAAPVVAAPVATATASSTATATTTAAPAAPAATPTATPSVTPASSSKADQLIAFLKAQIGKPYVWGATGPDSYDCSGLTQAAFASIGITIPRTSEEQSTFGTPVSLNALQPGDLIFWGGEGSAFHVGVFIGDGQYLDAANPSTPVGIKNLVDYEPDWAVRAF